MSTTRRMNTRPTYGVIESLKELKFVQQQIARFHPAAEVTLAGGKEVAEGRITQWFPARNFFEVKFSKKSPEFDALTDSDSSLRAFFKINLLSAQMIFKTTTVRRFSENVFHYRLPEEIYKQQRRGALRVPVRSSFLETDLGRFQLLDLSVGGAKIALPDPLSPALDKKLRVSADLAPAVLQLAARNRIQGKAFHAKITSRASGSFGVRFSGLLEADRVRIKQFLVEQLKGLF